MNTELQQGDGESEGIPGEVTLLKNRAKGAPGGLAG